MQSGHLQKKNKKNSIFAHFTEDQIIHTGLCSRWWPWKQNILYSENSLICKDESSEKRWAANPFRTPPGLDPTLLKKSTVIHTYGLWRFLWGFLIATILQQHMICSLNHVFGLGVGAGMHVNVAVLVLPGISCGILTGDIWCLSNQLALPLLFLLELRDQRWQQMGATNHMLTWSHFCCYFTYRTDLFECLKNLQAYVNQMQQVVFYMLNFV